MGELSLPTSQVVDNFIITVSDNGIGFDQKYADRAFEPFKRLNNKFSGTGIGLALCKKIMEIHGGSITEDSQPGNGTTFTLHFSNLTDKPIMYNVL